mmetsp:Transcript_14470/g.25097  ORF Transcript_14470/g.25097 Transcript_14470/m.25097 type:complete len:137 (+) Transcript_14470:235-645(+)
MRLNAAILPVVPFDEIVQNTKEIQQRDDIPVHFQKNTNSEQGIVVTVTWEDTKTGQENVKMFKTLLVFILVSVASRSCPKELLLVRTGVRESGILMCTPQLKGNNTSSFTRAAIQALTLIDFDRAVLYFIKNPNKL